MIDIYAYRICMVSSDIYIVGKAPDKNLNGISTKVVES
ncbi:hypothetical protein H6G26_40875 [Nostoc sp. FACHB-888]|nr:hypothetical protein [Nostoc sp. FACHB-888]